MTPDEHEARLRDAVIQHWHSPTCQNTHTIVNRGATIHCPERAQLLQVYADWLRLRERAGPCQYGKVLMDDDWVETCIVLKRAGVKKGVPCPPCAAQQQIAAILAAAGGAE